MGELDLARERASAQQLLKRLRRRRHWMPVLFSCLLFAALLRFVVGISVVSGVSMMPALYPGDVVVYARIWQQVENGDIVILTGRRTDVGTVKRVVGIGGDVLECSEDGHITRNGAQLSEPTVWYGWQDSRGWLPMPVTVPPNSVFCMGDNRPASLDSRTASMGAVALDRLEGKVLFILRLQ